jgi:hypothetical protein
MLKAADYIRNILTEIVARSGVEREVKGGRSCMWTMQHHMQQNEKSFCDDNFLRIASHPRHPPYSPDLTPSDFSYFLFGHLKTSLQSKDSNSGLQMKFSRESEKLWMKRALTLWKRFSGNERINRLDWADAFQHDIFGGAS